MPRMIGELVVLREWLENDIEELSWVTDAEITDKLSDNFLFPPTLLQIKNRVASFLDGSNSDKEFIIARKTDNKYLGQITFIHLDQKNQLGKIGIVIGDKKNHGKGYGKEAIELLLQFSFLRLNLHRIELDVMDFNDNAIALYQKCGFIIEGRRRECYFINGNFHDKINMAILKKEWLNRHQPQ